MRNMRAIWIACLAAFCLSACATTPPPDIADDRPPANDPGKPGPIINEPQPHPDPRPDPRPDPISRPQPHPGGPNINPFSVLPYWSSSDLRPAMAAFRRNCDVWMARTPSAPMIARKPEYGRIGDWFEACQAASRTGVSAGAARAFFETQFSPVNIATSGGSSGLVTGYYQPEIEARRRPDNVFSEPILTLPRSESARRLPRAKITGSGSRIIAYGRPIDVFFMQVQGSGVLRFQDGTKVRAGYAGNNGYKYKSIGRVLVERGQMNLEQASKQRIEDWMTRAGPRAARELMNQNPRYIYFAESRINPGEGPQGSMGVPLTAMGSVAIDPAFYPYGVPIWLTVKLPQTGGDYRGIETGQLLIAQDSGNAIKGAMRGDLYFGSGDYAGERAGVMKHPARWTVLLPKSLAKRLIPRS